MYTWVEIALAQSVDFIVDMCYNAHILSKTNLTYSCLAAEMLKTMEVLLGTAAPISNIKITWVKVCAVYLLYKGG